MMARKRFRNVSGKLQVLYDETGDKREIVPNGTIILEETWGARFNRFLEVVPDSPVEQPKKTASK
jgi:hypothetical protein